MVTIKIQTEISSVASLLPAGQDGFADRVLFVREDRRES
jgi:hypothetical protein